MESAPMLPGPGAPVPEATAAAPTHGGPLRDPQGRRLTYLRLSVTDRCNLRCAYCLPPEGIPLRPRQEILAYEELLLLVETAVALGMRKVRLTGGEPLVRRGLIDFVGALGRVPGLRRLALTTNGVLLAPLAERLRRAGLDAVNVSLDSLRPQRFARLTRGGRLADVLAGIEAAGRAGLAVKVNSVVLRGFNEDEIPDLARLAVARPLAVRFIGHLPTGGREGALAALGAGRRPLTGREILARLGDDLRLEPVPPGPAAGPAREFRVRGGAGRVGVISALDPEHCTTCNRLRVSATGRLRGCLLQDGGLELGPALRAGDREAVAAALLRTAARRAAGHGRDAETLRLRGAMSEMGG